MTKAVNPLLHKPSSTGAQPSPMSILPPWMSLLRFQTEQTRGSDAAPLPILAVGVYEMPGWGHSSIEDIAFSGQIRGPTGMTKDVGNKKSGKFQSKCFRESKCIIRVHIRRSPPK